MKDLFQQLHTDKEMPKNLEQDIMRSYDTLKLIADVTDLFTQKFGQSEMQMHLGLGENHKDEN